ncbi:hypothetical protein OG568_61060 (plasmid) [Streptomyces sp. NBC_01450]|uniref:hypothetical protein n=1 Tax=Streptomyces sp. NBC_01450 TaxID=2903871 RepID=UPI002E35407C|nr:hypothetical protein [Streptomyces sp. NBC_01450]
MREFVEAQEDLSSQLEFVRNGAKSTLRQLNDGANAAKYSSRSLAASREIIRDNLVDAIEATRQIEAGRDSRNITAEGTHNYSNLLNEAREDKRRLIKFYRSVIAVNDEFSTDSLSLSYRPSHVRRVAPFEGSITITGRTFSPPTYVAAAARSTPAPEAPPPIHQK